MSPGTYQGGGEVEEEEAEGQVDGAHVDGVDENDALCGELEEGPAEGRSRGCGAEQGLPGDVRLLAELLEELLLLRAFFLGVQGGHRLSFAVSPAGWKGPEAEKPGGLGSRSRRTG